MVMALLVAACGDDGASTEVGGGEADRDWTGPATVCEPSGSIEGAGSSTPFEDVEEYLTGFRITEENEGEPPPADPNFGGVWGDFAGGLVVGLVDCSIVDIDEVTRLGGGADDVRIIEVRVSYTEHYDAIGTLIDRLRELDVEGDAITDWTLDGPIVTLRVEDLAALPADFGADLPLTVTIQEGGYAVEQTEAIG